MTHPEHSEPSPEDQHLLDTPVAINEVVDAITFLTNRGYSEVKNLRQLKQEIEFTIQFQQGLGNLTPEVLDELLDAHLAVSRLLQEIEKS